jgi:TonB family protein
MGLCDRERCLLDLPAGLSPPGTAVRGGGMSQKMATKKILIVDFDQNSLAALQEKLSNEGFEVVTATDGQAGWNMYKNESPDLVLMEAMLPKVHGFELCQRITSEPSFQAKVFVMTGVYKDHVYRTEALRTYGASEYFEKPLNMARLLDSIGAVLGRPEPEPVQDVQPEPEPVPFVQPDPEPVPVVRPEPVMVEARKREKPRSDEDRFSLPADLDQLARAIPKIRKPAPARREKASEARLESPADERLMSDMAEPVPDPKKPAERVGSDNGNGHEGADIGQFLKSAPAGREIEKDKVKVPRPAPQPPAPPAPAVEKPAAVKPIVAKPVLEKPKPAPTPVPEFGFSMPEPAAKNTLMPGDPGSDISPILRPTKPRPQAPPGAPKAFVPKPPVMSAFQPKPPRPAEKPRPEPARPEPIKREPVRPEPVRHEPAKHKPARPEVKVPKIAPTSSGDIIERQEIFKHIGETKEKKGFPKLVFVAIDLVAIAVAAFLILRPKPAARPGQKLMASQTSAQAKVPVKPVVKPPHPVVKAEPVKPAAKKAELAPEAEGIVDPALISAAGPPLNPTTAEGSDNPPKTASSARAQNDVSVAKTETSAPPARTEAKPPATATAEPLRTADPGLKVMPPPAAAPAKKGDLVDLDSVTTPPELVKKVNPVYPPDAQARGIEGSITVNALINEKGKVIDTSILKGITDDLGLGKAAETALRKWKFEPARKDGVAVKVWMSFVIVFNADEIIPAPRNNWYDRTAGSFAWR